MGYGGENTSKRWRCLERRSPYFPVGKRQPVDWWLLGLALRLCWQGDEW